MVKIFRVLLVTFIFICCSSYGFSMPSYTEICAQLRSVSGWSSGKCDGMNAKATPMGDMVSAQKEYLKGNKKVEVMVLSGMNAMGMWAPYQNNMQIDTSDQFVKVTNIKGHNVAISYEKGDKSGGITIAFNSKKNPGMVNAVLVFSFSNMHWKDALEFAKKFDWDKLHKLFK